MTRIVLSSALAAIAVLFVPEAVVANPYFIGNYDTPNTVYAVAVYGHRAYLADDMGGLRIVDVTSPGAPALLGSFSTGSAVDGLAVSGNTAYLAGGYLGLFIVDVTDPSHPVQRSQYDDTDVNVYASCAAVSGTTAYVGFYNAGVRIFDVSNPAAPVLKSTYTGATSPWNLAIVGSRLYIADRDAGLKIVDVTNPSSPTLLGTYATSALGVTVWGGIAYVADTNGLDIVNIGTPSAPTLLGSMAFTQAWNATLAGTTVFLADGYYGFHVIDVTDPAHPLLLGTFTRTVFSTTADVHCVAVWGSDAYTASGSLGLDIVGGSIAKRTMGYYPFDDPNTGVDASGRNHNGVVGFATVVNDGACHQALHFPFDDNKPDFTVPNSDDFNLVGPMTAIARVRPLGPHGQNGLSSCTDGTIFSKEGNNWFELSQNNDALEFQNEGSGSPGNVASRAVTIPIGAWSQVAVVREADGRTVHFYKNGEPVGEPYTLGLYAAANGSDLMVGNYGYLNDPGACEFNGDIDELAIYGEAWADRDIRSTYDNFCGMSLVGGDGGSAGENLAPKRPMVRRGSAFTRMQLTEGDAGPAIEFDLIDPVAEVSVFDVRGRRIASLPYSVAVGRHARAVWSGASTVPVGNYWIMVRQGGVTRSLRYTKLARK